MSPLVGGPVDMLIHHPQRITVWCGPCARCGTVVRVAGNEHDPIVSQVKRWGTSCPMCKTDLEPHNERPGSHY